jgi:hypothetical protein
MRWTDQDLADYQERRGSKAKPSSIPPGQGTSRSPKRESDKVESRRDYKAELVQQFQLVGIPVEPEFHFAKPRKFRADWRVKGLPVLIEYDGGIFMAGKAGHSSVKGLLRDIEKMNMAAIAGYIVIRVTPKHVVSGEALLWVEQACLRARALIAVVEKSRKDLEV